MISCVSSCVCAVFHRKLKAWTLRLKSLADSWQLGIRRTIPAEGPSEEPKLIGSKSAGWLPNIRPLSGVNASGEAWIWTWTETCWFFFKVTPLRLHAQTNLLSASKFWPWDSFDVSRQFKALDQWALVMAGMAISHQLPHRHLLQQHWRLVCVVRHCDWILFSWLTTTWEPSKIF